MKSESPPLSRVALFLTSANAEHETDEQMLPRYWASASSSSLSTSNKVFQRSFGQDSQKIIDELEGAL